jgi:hypothetical protein
MLALQYCNEIWITSQQHSDLCYDHVLQSPVHVAVTCCDLGKSPWTLQNPTRMIFRRDCPQVDQWWNSKIWNLEGLTLIAFETLTSHTEILPSRKWFHNIMLWHALQKRALSMRLMTALGVISKITLSSYIGLYEMGYDRRERWFALQCISTIASGGMWDLFRGLRCCIEGKNGMKRYPPLSWLPLGLHPAAIKIL